MQKQAFSITKKITGSFLRRFFLLLYHQLAWTYDFVAWTVSLGKWKTWVNSVVPFLIGPRILEIGHGPGHLQSTLLSRGIWACGLDESRWMSAIAAKRSNRLINGLAQELPFQAGTFSQVVATFPAEFIFRLTTLSEVFRVLEPGGSFVLMPVAWITGRRTRERIAAWLFRVTGEAPERTPEFIRRYFSDPLEQAHFQVSTSIIEVSNSDILIITARKSDANSDLPFPRQVT